MKRLPRQLIERTRRVHLVGVGGIGVSALAELLVARGLEVSGTDRAASPTLARLRSLGVDARTGEHPELAARAELLIFTSAAREDHPERVAAREAGVPQFPRGAALGALVEGRQGIGLAGAHGKTTTTTIMAHLLEELGEDPCAAVGGEVAPWGSPARVGEGRWFVAEADESDRSFLALPLAYAVALNVDRDHLENYDGPEDLRACFLRFLQGASTRAVVHVEDPVLRELAAELDPARRLTVGTGEDADLCYHGVEVRDGRVGFEVVFRGEELGRFELPRPGVHDAGNAACALAVALDAGLPALDLRAALACFPGVDRRFTVRGETDRVRVVDDYAHMPVEVAVTLAAARHACPDRRLVAVFQPHLYSRTRDHADAFGAALEAADRAWVLPVYPAREEPIEGVEGHLVAAGHPGVEFLDVPDLDAAAAAVLAELRPGDLVLTMGAGSVTAVGPRLLRQLQRRVLARELPDLVADSRLDEPLARHSFFGIGGPAWAVAWANGRAELEGLLGLLRQHDIPFKVLSAGSNVLIADAGYEGVVVRLGRGFRFVEEVGETDDGEVELRVGASTPMAILHRDLERRGLSGLECAHHIPGFVGGAVVNNAGAYGQEMLDRVVTATVMEPDGTLSEWDQERLEPRYRSSSLKGTRGFVVLAVRLCLERSTPEAVRAEARRQAEERNRTQPAGRGSAGCAFKNPPGASAGQLIDQAGCKGWSRGGAHVSEVHGNYLMNDGSASAADVVELMEAVRARVLEVHGLVLELEVELLGDFPPPGTGGAA